MNTNDYILLIEKMYEKHFTLEKKAKVLDFPIDIYARYSDIGGRTFLTKKDIIDKFEVNEHCFVKSFQEFNESDLDNFINFLKMATEKIVNHSRDHKCSTITGVIISQNQVKENILKTITKFKFTKPYLFYLHGWSDIRLIFIDLQNENIITNREGKKVKKVYQSTLLNK